ncbi:Aspartyl aminopeptidase [Psilocybe cubensis]|uniref:aspartyl aminopeptidase n=2 Tax=Psilocybe cubensis TaxID=181762 RepID=A0A8H8CL61_PSICU|nr:Aspartyl aminopeptidase [Psilocybe cubensis]KAH9482938.1 Aspartyl aminopeptidase [Psilocybe cubensis]
MMLYPAGPKAATRFLDFVNASPTPFHAVYNASIRLENAGFQKIREKDEWEKTIQPGGKYYFTRNQSALIAFTLPQKWKQGAGLSIVATHVDSPNLKIRPISKRTKSPYLQVGVETYGGGIWHSWLDRDLSVAGRVVVSDSDGNFTSKLVKVDRPILRIPTLAIHLDRNVNDNFKFNQETEFVPILGLIESQFNSAPAKSDPASGQEQKPSVKAASSIQENHHPALLSLLGKELSVAPEKIHDFELSLYDTQLATLGGINNEFIFSPRMDNLVSSFCAVEALADSANSQYFPTLEGNVNCIALFNHEEIGSVSTSGAESSLIPSLLNRLSPTPGSLAQSITHSFLISADMGHAVHPNYYSKHEENHKPVMNGGIVIKTNAKQRYATDAISTFIVKQLVERKGGKVQEFEVRNDIPCGSTVGPMLSKIGIRTVDVGNAMLSMHSIRETAGSNDVQSAIDLFSAFFEGFSTLDATLTMD